MSIFPWINVLKYKSKLREHQDERRLRRYDPAPLPRTRKRRLSDGHMAPQVRSSFLMKLPLEIRALIYEYVFIDGSEHRHIVELCIPK